MSGAGFILVINIAVAGLFCASFLVIAALDRRCLSARWFAGGYAVGMAYPALEAALPVFPHPGLVFLGHQTFAGALLLLNIGLARRYEAVPPRLLLGAAAMASLVAGIVLVDLPRASFLRNFLYQGPLFLMQAIGLYIVLRASATRPVGRGMIDTLLAFFLGFSALHFLAKPFIAVMLGTGGSPGEYLSTTYAMISQTMGAVVAIATALILLAALILDMVKAITARSETDSLSGLLNRRGFEDRLADIVGRLPRDGVPVSPVICDLDHFKAVNDTWGHAAGDRVIAAFSATLRESAAGHHVVGRIGGEEFAALLPGFNLPAARLFAESVRMAFAGRAIEGFPEGESFTASFGVAEIAPGETAASLLLRADLALYEAKRAGRDCVRLGADADGERRGTTAIDRRGA
ncbi:MAG TPA: GGDEF domain-containing protein [Aquamicrobium sp.]|nr:GGDEF domain-containing protein [Aquamicrobium sp.]